MKKLTQIFGVLVEIFFTTTNGVTLSEISRIQAENKQQNDKFWSLIADAVAGVYRKVITFLGGGRSSEKVPGIAVTVENIREYRGVAERNAQTSSLMHALKLHKRLQSDLRVMDLQGHIVDELPEEPKYPAHALRGTACETDSFMDMANIDEMIGAMHGEVLAKFDHAFFKKANELNSRAAALGKLLSEQGSFFRELVKSTPRGTDQLAQNGVIITSWEKAYESDSIKEFETLRNDLQEEYNDLQKQLNGCRKQMKDAVRGYDLAQERLYQTSFGLYRVQAEKHALEMERIRSAAETLRQEALAELAGLKVRTE